MNIHLRKFSNNNNLFSVTERGTACKRRFQKPTEEEVERYCRQRQNHVDANRFCNFYESKGWMVGKAKMVDWQAAVRTWERREEKPLYPRQPDELNAPAPPPATLTTTGGIQYYNGRPLPPDAPPRPSATAEWDESTQSWFELYK